MKILLQFVDGWEKVIEIDNSIYHRGELFISIILLPDVVYHENTKVKNIEIAKARFIRTGNIGRNNLPIFKYY